MAAGRRHTTWRGLGVLYRSSPGAVVALLVTQAIDGVAPAVVVAASASLLDHATGAETSPAARRAVTVALAVVAVTLVLSRVARAVVSLLHHFVAERFVAAIERLRLEAVTRLPGLAHFDDAELASRLQSSSWASEAGQIVNYGSYLLRWASLAAAAGAVAARLGWWVPALLAVGALPGAVIAWRHSGEEKALRQGRADAWRHADYHLGLAVGVEAAREVRLFAMGDWLQARQGRHWRRAMSLLLRELSRQLRRDLLAGTAAAACGAVPLVVAYRGLRAGDLSVGDFSAAVVSLGIVFSILRWVALFPAELGRTVQFLPDLFEVVDLADTDPRLCVGGTRRLAGPPAAGIQFDDVRFTYPGTDRPVLDGFNLRLPAGSSVAVVGANGAGKSTIVKLLCRLYDPDDGRITVDGVDLRELDLDAWRASLAVVFQDFLRLPMSARENVGIGCVTRVDDAELLRTAAMDSGADAVVERLLAGWDTVLAPEFGGVDVSGGEWQRLALARSLMARHGRDASVLVLDEPTAALDVRLEHDLYERFEQMGHGATTLLISHRFSTVRMADRIVVLEDGRIGQEGTHHELMALGGRYAELFGLQARRFV